MPNGLVAGRGLVRGQPGLQASRGLVQGVFERALQGQVPLGLAKLAQLVGHRVCQDHPQPGGKFRLRLSPEFVQILVGLQQRLLYQVRRVEFALEPGVQVETGQQVQVFAEALQGPGAALSVLGHTSPYSKRQKSRADEPREIWKCERRGIGWRTVGYRIITAAGGSCKQPADGPPNSLWVCVRRIELAELAHREFHRRYVLAVRLYRR